MRPVIKNPPPYFKEYASSDGPVLRETIQNALIDAIGNYCSYCEMPLSGYQVEHHRLLADWQTNIQYSDWDDLLLICKDCREHIRTSLLSAEEKDNMLWPDLHETFGVHEDSPIQYELRDVTYTVVGEEGEIHSSENRRLVFVVANERCDDNTRRAAQNTIDHFQLNMKTEFYNEETNELRVPLRYQEEGLDNRIFKRTQAWFEAMDSVNRLRELDNYNDTPGIESIKKLLKEQISMHTYYSGNWSVWMTVFGNEFRSNGLLREVLLGDPRYFPGTAQKRSLFFKE